MLDPKALLGNMDSNSLVGKMLGGWLKTLK